MNERDTYIVYTSKFIKTEDGFDLNEISYLSLFTDTIIGRCSGPHVFAQVLDNWMNPNKKSISFTYTIEGSHFVLMQPLKMKKYWSSANNPDIVFRHISEIISER